MLELKNIIKDYPAGNTVVKALKGVSVSFRKSEFVSILGPSGCGKTTLLNIIGGLDKYTSGDLIIGGRSTKDFHDRDWDAYRNHSIGFVFQSYHLIPHQTVLQNVELALTLAGVGKKERKTRAKAALESVGLGDQLNKRPGEMSGGQMQRVAIARALVNDPEIILADEPTGALDTETGIQVMEILKEVSKHRLVIMVTHNPELADNYSTRIIRMLDGEITDDSNPLTEEEYALISKKPADIKKKSKKPTMSFSTAFMLSLKNLFTKKGRTFLTAFAGSIGIIGIALILSISQGMTAYIDTVQEEALSSYPITIEDATVDMTSLMSAFMGIQENNVPHEKDAVYKKSALYDMLNALNSLDMQENDLRAFKAYLEEQVAKEEKEGTLSAAINGIKYSYPLPLTVYTKNVDGNIIHSDTTKLMTDIVSKYMGADMSSLMSFGESSSGIVGTMTSSSINMREASMGLWQEMLSGKDGSPINSLLYDQYDLVYGAWPNSYDEIVLVLDKNNELDDMTLYALGLLSEKDVDNVMSAAMDGKILSTDEKSWSYEEICALEYRVVCTSDCFTYDSATGLYKDLRETDAGIRYLYDNGLKLKVTGIIRPSKDATAHMLNGSIGYTADLTEHIITKSHTSKAVIAQMESEKRDIITGLPFSANTGNLTDEEKEAELRAYLDSLEESERAAAYIKIKSIPSKETLEQMVNQSVGSMTREEISQAMISAISAQMGVDTDEIVSYVESMDENELKELFNQMAAEQIKMQYAQKVAAEMSAMPTAALSQALAAELSAYTTEECALYYDEITEFSKATYEDNLLTLGYVDLDDPSSINIYASSFANKDIIEEGIAKYNEGKEELEKIKYTDYIGIMMSSITTIINAITYVLIAFVAISLIVSSIMIGVITLISVQERTKEIGILRAIGASKKNVSSMFTAETVIIGFASGALGVIVTYILCIPINIIINNLTGIQNLDAIFPPGAALILILISIALTLISGRIPSKSAAKKDPVEALRTE